MKLPVVTQPLFEETIPSTNQKIEFRPFVVKEEKILLVAQQGNSTDIIRSIKQVLTSCVQDNINIDTLATFDLEYLFLKLRAKSVNNIAKVSYHDPEDNEIREFEIDLDEIKITFNEKNNKNIKITDTIGIIMKYPSAAISDKVTEFENEVELMEFFIINTIDQIYDEEGVYMASDYSEEELKEFLDSLNVATFEKIKEFFETMPKLYHKIEYTNNKGTERVIEFNNLRDFFLWG